MTGTHQLPWRPPPPGLVRLGRYRLLAEIARGGIGAVHVGCADGPTGFRKLVAIKTVRSDLAAEPALIRMLVEEAQLASRLHHPNIAQLYDLGDDGGPFLVMEYVHGESLSALLTTIGAFPARLAVAVAGHICDALAYAHTLVDERGSAIGLVHRDVSPQNILLGYEGVPRLVDFGIARAQHRAGDTEQGVVKGRFAYMAPEQRAGRRVDGRADLHALGVVLYQMTVGAHPWELAGDRADTDPIPDPRPHRPGYPDALWSLIERATAADPDQRFADAAAMLAALREVGAGLGPVVDRSELAALIDEPFAARRAAKQQMLDGRTIDGDTEVLGTPAQATPPPISVTASGYAGARASGSGDSLVRGERPPADPARGAASQPPPAPAASARPHRWVRYLVAGAVLAGAVLALLAMAAGGLGDRRPAPPDDERPAGAAGAPAMAPPRRPCLLADTSGSLAERDATWIAVRLVGMALDRHPVLAIHHGYRVQDREGWNPTGRVAAEAACAAAGADVVVDLAVRPDGSARLSAGGQPLAEVRGAPLDRSRRLAEQLAARWADESPTWRAVLPDWPDASLKPLLDVREALVLQRPDPMRKRTFELLARELPSLEFVFIAENIARWWAGELDDPAARAAMPRPADAGSRSAALLAAIADLAAGEEARADDSAARALEDQRWARDPLTLYLAGEARVHAGRPAEGTGLLERALTADPQLTPALFHIFDRRLAEGDWAGAERIAALWDRVVPGSPRAIEMRGHVALGQGRHADAARIFESLLDRSRSDAAGLHGPGAGLIHARLMSGDVAGAIAHARQLAIQMGDFPAMTWVLPEPILYAWALGRGDDAQAADWEAGLRRRLAGAGTSPNWWQLAYSVAILEHMAGRRDARARWIGAGPPPGVPRRYRFEPQAHVFEVLEAAIRRDHAALTRAARSDADLPAFHLARALLARLAGRQAEAAAELEAAMASSASGELDCVAAALLVDVQRAAGDAAGAAATCRRILAPRVPRPYCLVARRSCPPAA